jgi:hypothetical protein
MSDASEQPPVDYGHYTSPGGLMGIVRDEGLWATNIKFLNDQHEFQHALDLIKRIINKRTALFGASIPPLYSEFRGAMDIQLAALESFTSESVFTYSFSTQVDLLSQWRGYCPDNNGYCIVFDADQLHKGVCEKFDNCHFVKCVYDDSEKEEQIRKVLNDHWRKYQTLGDRKDRKANVDELANEILLLASYFKHLSFKEEQEHRIVVLLNYAADHDLKFREGRSSLIPYIELPASRELIRKIIVGPNPNQALANRALQSFLEKSTGVPSFVSKVDIKDSNIPYRPL